MTKILVIEDEASIRENIVESLHYAGYDAIGAEDGEVGIARARSDLPDLIVCDVLMPKINGFEVLEELRGDFAAATIPFIFLTARSDREAVRQGMEMGADDYVTKPFTLDELMRAVRSQLDKKAASESEHLRALSHRLMEMHETLRYQVAREFGGEVSEMVAGLHFLMEAIKRTTAASGQASLDQAQDLLTQLSVRVRELAFELRPSALDDLGLLPVLSQYFERYTRNTQIDVDFRHSGMGQRFQGDTEITAFRIIQEALNNVAGHARVQAVSVRVWVEQDMLRIRIDDKGAGFDLETVLTSGHASGLRGMHGRATLLGGQLTIESRRGVGTCLMAWLPAVSLTTAGSQESLLDSLSVVGGFSRPGETDIPPQRAASPEPDAPVRVVLADSHDLSRRGMRSLLEHEHGLKIIGEVEDGQRAKEVVKRLKPDVLVIDFMLMGSTAGFDLPQYVAQVSPQTRILVLSVYPEEAYVLRALKSGATGYALKQSRSEDLIQAVYAVAQGQRYVSPTLSAHTIEAWMALQEEYDEDVNMFEMLTPREREILILVTEGRTSTAIAEQLSISPRTVETHRANMMSKIGVRNQADLIRYALQYGIL